MNGSNRRQEAEQRRRQRCVHFTGMQNKKCEAGHEYTNPLPCLAPYKDGERGTCVDLRLPTEEELAAEDRENARRLVMYRDARKAINAHIQAKGMKGKNWGDTIPCPCCKGGTLGFSYAGGYNGHIHARCSTSGCVAWME